MTLTVAHIQPIIALIAGILILIMPRILNFVIRTIRDHEIDGGMMRMRIPAMRAMIG